MPVVCKKTLSTLEVPLFKQHGVKLEHPELSFVATCYCPSDTLAHHTAKIRVTTKTLAALFRYAREVAQADAQAWVQVQAKAHHTLTRTVAMLAIQGWVREAVQQRRSMRRSSKPEPSRGGAQWDGNKARGYLASFVCFVQQPSYAGCSGLPCGVSMPCISACHAYHAYQPLRMRKRCIIIIRKHE